MLTSHTLEKLVFICTNDDGGGAAADDDDDDCDKIVHKHTNPRFCISSRKKWMREKKRFTHISYAREIYAQFMRWANKKKRERDRESKKWNCVWIKKLVKLTMESHKLRCMVALCCSGILFFVAIFFFFCARSLATSSSSSSFYRAVSARHTNFTHNTTNNSEQCTGTGVDWVKCTRGAECRVCYRQ